MLSNKNKYLEKNIDSRTNNLINFIKNAIKVDAVIFTGGGIIQDRTSLLMIIFLSIKFYNHKNESKGLLIFISFFIFLAFYVRWINYYFFFIPLIMKLMFFSDSKFNLYKNKFFIFSSILNIFIFLSLSKSIYGLFTLNAADIYGLNLSKI